jgi:hypothetical protein
MIADRVAVAELGRKTWTAPLAIAAADIVVAAGAKWNSGSATATCCCCCCSSWKIPVVAAAVARTCPHQNCTFLDHCHCCLACCKSSWCLCLRICLLEVGNGGGWPSVGPFSDKIQALYRESEGNMRRMDQSVLRYSVFKQYSNKKRKSQSTTCVFAWLVTRNVHCHSSTSSIRSQRRRHKDKRHMVAQKRSTPFRSPTRSCNRMRKG